MIYLKWIKAGLKSVFSFSYTSFLTKAKEPSLSNYLLIVRRTAAGFLPFLRALSRNGTQAVSFKIWTWVTDSISYDEDLWAKYVSNQ